MVAAVHRAARVVRRRLAAETGTHLRACRPGRRARGRAGVGAREGTGIALLALPRADPRQGPLRAPVAPRREGDGRAGAAAREAARGRDAARHRGAVRILQADAVSALEARADCELQLPGLGEPLQARRGRLLPPRRALRRGSVPRSSPGEGASRTSWWSVCARGAEPAPAAAERAAGPRRLRDPPDRARRSMPCSTRSGRAGPSYELSTSARSPPARPTRSSESSVRPRSRPTGETSRIFSRPRTRRWRRLRNRGRWLSSTTAGHRNVGAGVTGRRSSRSADCSGRMRGRHVRL